MSNLFFIQVRPQPGTDIRTACVEGVALAKKLGCGIEFEFNGELVILSPHSDPEAHAQDFWRRIGGKGALP